MTFLARALKKNIFFDVDIVVKKQIEMWFIVVCTLTDNEYVSLLVSQTFFSYCFYILSEFVKVFERKVWRVQAANLHNAARAFSSSSRCFQLSRQIFIFFDIVVKNKSHVVKRGLYSCRQRCASLQWSKCCATNWATSQNARFALVIEYVSSIHPWANSRSWISQSERALCFS